MSKPSFGTGLNSGDALYSNIVMAMAVNEGSGATIKDTVSANPFALNGGYTWSAAGLAFDGVSGSYSSNITYASAQAVTSAWTIIWYGTFNGACQYGTEILLGKDGAGGGFLDWALCFKDTFGNGDYRLDAFAKASSGDEIRGGTTLSSGTTYLMAATWNGTTLTVWVNGTADGNSSGASAPGTDGGVGPQIDAYQNLLQGPAKHEAIYLFNKALNSTEIGRFVTDPYTVWAAGGGTAYTATPSDTVTLSATVAAHQNMKQAGFADTVTLSATVAASMGAHLGPADTVTLSAALATKYNAKTAPADTVTLSAALAASQGAHLAPADTVALSDSQAVKYNAKVAPGDTVAYSETLTNPSGAVYTVSISDSWTTYSASLAASMGAHLGPADTVTLSATLSAAQGMKQTGFADTVGLSDGQAVKYNAKTAPADTVTLSATVAASQGSHVAPADTVTLSATAAAKYNAKVAPADTVNLFDVLTNPSGAGASPWFFLVQ